MKLGYTYHLFNTIESNANSNFDVLLRRILNQIIQKTVSYSLAKRYAFQIKETLQLPNSHLIPLAHQVIHTTSSSKVKSHKDIKNIQRSCMKSISVRALKKIFKLSFEEQFLIRITKFRSKDFVKHNFSHG